MKLKTIISIGLCICISSGITYNAYGVTTTTNDTLNSVKIGENEKTINNPKLDGQERTVKLNNGWVSKDGVWYYYINDTMQKGFINVDGHKYYLNENGQMVTGWLEINNKHYFFGEWGQAAIGWIKIENKWYYFEQDGSSKLGWLRYNNKWYYIKPGAEMAIGWVEDNGQKYFLDNDGIMKTGWLQTKGKWYYFNGSGQMVKGWAKLDNKWYYLDGNGQMTVGWLELGQKKYFLDNSGVMKTGWLQTKGKWYYFNGSGEMVKGWAKLENKWYYLNENGQMIVGWLDVGGNKYYLDNSGVMKTGWLQTGGKWYYFNGSGEMKTGWITVDKNRYYLNSNGQMLTGWIELGGKHYLLSSSGVMQTGWAKSGGYWYYLKDNGEMATGWIKVSAKWYYLYDGGSMAVNTTIDGYTVGSDGSWYKARDKFAKAEAAARQYVGSSNVGVYCMDLETGESFDINGDKIYPAASTAKLTSLLYAQRRLNEGSLSLGTTYKYYDAVNDMRGAYQRGGSGILQGQLKEGSSVSVERLIKATASYSDNLGANMLAYHVTNQSDVYYMSYIKSVLGREIRNYTKDLSPKDLAILMGQTHYEGGLALASLKNTSWDNVKIPKYLPVPVAHKIGIHDEANNDVAIVYTDRPYVISIMTPFYTDEYISKLSKVVYDQLK